MLLCEKMRRYPFPVLTCCTLAFVLLTACSSSSNSESATEAVSVGRETDGLGSLEQNAIYAMGLNYAQELDRLGYTDEQVEIVGRALRASAEGGFREIPPPPEDLTTPEQREAWVKGLGFANTAIRLELSPEETDFMLSAIDDARAGQAKIEYEPYRWLIPRLSTRRAQEKLRNFTKASLDYLEEAAKKPGVVVTEDGLIYEEIQPGTGATPTREDTVRVNYEGTLVDGTVFDSSEQHGGPQTFPLSGVVLCWSKGLAMMKEGGKARLVCPSTLAYQNIGQGEIPPNATLIFDVELLQVL